MLLLDSTCTHTLVIGGGLSLWFYLADILLSFRMSAPPRDNNARTTLCLSIHSRMTYLLDYMSEISPNAFAVNCELRWDILVDTIATRKYVFGGSRVGTQIQGLNTDHRSINIILYIIIRPPVWGNCIAAALMILALQAVGAFDAKSF